STPAITTHHLPRRRCPRPCPRPCPCPRPRRPPRTLRLYAPAPSSAAPKLPPICAPASASAPKRPSAGAHPSLIRARVVRAVVVLVLDRAVRAALHLCQ